MSVGPVDTPTTVPTKLTPAIAYFPPARPTSSCRIQSGRRWVHHRRRRGLDATSVIAERDAEFLVGNQGFNGW